MVVVVVVVVFAKQLEASNTGATMCYCHQLKHTHTQTNQIKHLKKSNQTELNKRLAFIGFQTSNK